MHCSNCQGSGHNRRSCRFAPVLNGRRQRARDRESISNTNSRASSDSNSNGDLDSSLDSDLDGDLDGDYNAIIAEAWEVYERNGSGMEGIEIGGGSSKVTEAQGGGRGGSEVPDAQGGGNGGSEVEVPSGSEVKVSRYGRILRTKTK